MRENAQPLDRNLTSDSSVWSLRVLVLAVAGIIFLTCYPFDFGLPAGVSAWKLPFRLESGLKPVGVLDDVLNILLFMPFGFGVAGLLHSRAKSVRRTVAITWGLGILLSYSVEFTQYYIPYRDSGWHDVITNSTGALLGALLFNWLGTACLELVARAEATGAAILVRPHGAWLIAGYLSAWMIIAIPLQMRTRLASWDPNCLLIVGNLVTTRSNTAWRGEVYRLEVWNKAVPADAARRITRGEPADISPTGLVAGYDFTNPSALKDQRSNLPDLAWSGTTEQIVASKPVVLNGKSWLTSKVPVTSLIKDIQQTSQFSVHVVCRPADPGAEDWHVMTLSRPPGVADIDLEQNHGDLVFWFRSPLSVRHYPMSWVTTGFFKEKRVYDMLFTYDGADLSLFVDGQKEHRLYRMGPGTALARIIRNVKPAELEGYRYTFCAIVFFPAGVFLGLARRETRERGRVGWLAAAAMILVSAVLLEAIQMRVSGRGMIVSGPVVSVCFAAAGAWWINLRQRERT